MEPVQSGEARGRCLELTRGREDQVVLWGPHGGLCPAECGGSDRAGSGLDRVEPPLGRGGGSWKPREMVKHLFATMEELFQNHLVPKVRARKLYSSASDSSLPPGSRRQEAGKPTCKLPVYLVGWMGGWAWSDLFPLRGVGPPRSRILWAKAPQRGSWVCCSTSTVRFKSLGKMFVSVRG